MSLLRSTLLVGAVEQGTVSAGVVARRLLVIVYLAELDIQSTRCLSLDEYHDASVVPRVDEAPLADAGELHNGDNVLQPPARSRWSRLVLIPNTFLPTNGRRHAEDIVSPYDLQVLSSVMDAVSVEASSEATYNNLNLDTITLSRGLPGLRSRIRDCDFHMSEGHVP